MKLKKKKKKEKKKKRSFSGTVTLLASVSWKYGHTAEVSDTESSSSPVCSPFESGYGVKLSISSRVRS